MIEKTQLEETLKKIRDKKLLSKESDENTITRPEYMIIAGVGEKIANKELDTLVESGILKRGMVGRMTKWGTPQKVRGYLFVEETAVEIKEESNGQKPHPKEDEVTKDSTPVSEPDKEK